MVEGRTALRSAMSQSTHSFLQSISYLQSPGSLSEIVHVSVWYAEAIGSHDRPF